jgi:hypothetical protein
VTFPLRAHWYVTVWAYGLFVLDEFVFHFPVGVPLGIAASALLLAFLLRLAFRTRPGDAPGRISSAALDHPTVDRPRYGTVTRTNGETILVVFHPVEGEADTYIGLDAGTEEEVEMGEDDTLFVKGGIPPGVWIKMAEPDGDRE